MVLTCLILKTFPKSKKSLVHVSVKMCALQKTDVHKTELQMPPNNLIFTKITSFFSIWKFIQLLHVVQNF